MGKVGWYSLAVAVLCAVALIGAPWTVRVSLEKVGAFAADDDGLLSLLPDDAPLDLNAGSTATDSGPASNPLAGGAPAATKRLPSAAPAATPSSSLLDSRQQELSLNTSAAIAEKAPPSTTTAAVTQAKLTPGPSPAPPKAAQPKSTPKQDPKPAVSQAKPKPAAKTDPAPAKTEASAASTGTSSFITDMDLPEATNPKLDPNAPAPSLRELFSAEEIDNPLTDSGVVASAAPPDFPADVPPISNEHGGTLATVINTGHANGGVEEEGAPTLGQILRGEAEESEVGSSLAGYNPVRSGAMVLLVLGFLFVGAWIAKKFKTSSIPGFKQKALAVIETVSIGPGRQLIIVEMNNDALVLGVTPHSINMLDKVPLAELNGSYQHTVNAIIEREENALPADWQDRPLFAPNGNVSPAPALAAAGTYGPSGRITVSQLRQSGAYGSQARSGSGIVPTHLLQERNTKAELIDRIRQQLNNLER